MKRILLVLVLLWSQFGHSGPLSCETLLEAKSARAVMNHLLDKKLNSDTTLGLKGRFQSVPPNDLIQFQALDSRLTEIGVHLHLQRVSVDQGETVIDFTLSGLGKNLIKALLALDFEPLMKAAKYWTVWQVVEGQEEESELLAPSEIYSEQQFKNLSLPLAGLPLSNRAYRALYWDGIHFVGDLVQMKSARLLRVPSFGRKSLNEADRVLANMGYSFGMQIPDWKREEISPVVQKMVADRPPVFHFSEWSQLSAHQVGEFLRILSLRSRIFLLAEDGDSLLALMPQNRLQEESSRQLVREMTNPPLLRDPKIEWVELFDRYRAEAKLAHSMDARHLVGAEGAAAFAQIAKEGKLMRIPLSKNQEEDLLLMPLPVEN